MRLLGSVLSEGVAAEMGKNSFYAKYIKRLLDIGCALAAILAFWWLYIILASLVRLKLGSPVIFCQKRPGKDGKIFELYKFRSMSDARDEYGKLLPDSVRLIRFGRILRATSLDELPEAFNILKGDMSVIGPRPLAVAYLPYYNEQEMHRHDVRPGLSGWAQVNGRTALDWEKRFEYDVEYVNKMSFLFDVKIIFKTIAKVLKHSDIVEAGSQGDFDKYRKEQMEKKTKAK